MCIFRALCNIGLIRFLKWELFLVSWRLHDRHFTVNSPLLKLGPRWITHWQMKWEGENVESLGKDQGQILGCHYVDDSSDNLQLRHGTAVSTGHAWKWVQKIQSIKCFHKNTYWYTFIKCCLHCCITVWVANNQKNQIKWQKQIIWKQHSIMVKYSIFTLWHIKMNGI